MLFGFALGGCWFTSRCLHSCLAAAWEFVAGVFREYGHVSFAGAVAKWARLFSQGFFSVQFCLFISGYAFGEFVA